MTHKASLARSDVERLYSRQTGQRRVFAEFSTVLESIERPFPCLFAIQGYQSDQLRYIFQADIDMRLLAITLGDFLQRARSFGPNTSLVLFTKPDKTVSLDVYRKTFWTLLHSLVQVDDQPWPNHIPIELSNPLWEFSFAGEPIFVVCNTPAHLLRQSRKASCFMVTLQPRWVFDQILGTDKAAEQAFSAVRKRLIPYDPVLVSPALGKYGHPDTYEYQQYFLSDDNQPAACPFRTLLGGGSTYRHKDR